MSESQTLYRWVADTRLSIRKVAAALEGDAPGLNLTCDVEGTMAAHMDHFEDAAISVD